MDWPDGYGVMVIRGAGPEFADEAFRVLRVFRFKPANDSSGQPTAVAIIFEIVFVTE
jgi:hypothetical protein